VYIIKKETGLHKHTSTNTKSKSCRL